MAHPDLVAMTVHDMAASLKFYRLLGLELPTDADVEPHVELILAGGFRLAWDTEALIKSLYPDWTEGHSHRLTLAFKCDNPAEVDALHAQVVGSGFESHTAPWDAFWGQRYAVVVDPDGNWVDLFAAME